jgi:hypothetical protein
MSPSTAQPQPAAAMELQQQPPVQADQPRVHQGMGTSQELLLPPQSWPRPADLYRPHEAARRDRDEPARRRRRRHVPRPLLLLHPVPDTVQLLHHPSVRGCACSFYDGGGLFVSWWNVSFAWYIFQRAARPRAGNWVVWDLGVQIHDEYSDILAPWLCCKSLREVPPKVAPGLFLLIRRLSCQTCGFC